MLHCLYPAQGYCAALLFCGGIFAQEFLIECSSRSARQAGDQQRREAKTDNVDKDRGRTVGARSAPRSRPRRGATRRRGSRYASAISASKLRAKVTTSPRSGSGTLNVSRVTDKQRMNAA